MKISKSHLKKSIQWSKLEAGSKSGVTLIELTVVIVVLLTLIGVSVYSMSGYRDYKLRSKAEVALMSVYTAQRTYLAEHPTTKPSALKKSDIVPYLSNGESDFPVVKDLNGITLTYDIKVSPPVFTNDPSGSDTDGQWDLSD